MFVKFEERRTRKGAVALFFVGVDKCARLASALIHQSPI
jgi:hypothetical protein